MTTQENATPELKLWKPRNLPTKWVVEIVSTGELFMFDPPCGGRTGWDHRQTYRGYRESLDSVPGYCYAFCGLPLRRLWVEVCKDRNGMN